MFKVKRNLKSATKRNCCLVRHKFKKIKNNKKNFCAFSNTALIKYIM